MSGNIIIYGSSSLISLELIKILDKDASKFYLFCRNKNEIEKFILKNNFDKNKFIIFEVDLIDLKKNLELINNIIIVDPVVKNNSKSIKNPNRKENKSGDFPEDGGLPIAIKGDAEHFSKMFTDFTIEDSVWCVGEKWYLNTDNKYYKDFAKSKEFANVPSNFIEAQFEKSLILLGISLKSNNVDEDEIKNILRGQAQVSVPIIYALEYKKNK